MDKRRARAILRKMGKATIQGFLDNYSEAIELKSKDPSVCWNVSGIFHYAVVDDVSGPNIHGGDSPLILRLRVNQDPPPALYYYLKHCTPPLSESVIATTPILDIRTLPWEMPKFGGWVLTWHRCHYKNDPCPPDPPIKLVNMVGKMDLSEQMPDFNDLGPAWLHQSNFWTQRALEEFEPWWKKSCE